MSKYLVLAAALVVLAVACNKKEEAAAPAEGTTGADLLLVVRGAGC